MSSIPTLRGLLESIPTGAGVYRVWLEASDQDGSVAYPYYQEIEATDEEERDRVWTGVKLRRAGRRRELSAPWRMSICHPGLLESLLLEVTAPLAVDCRWSEAASRFDRSEACIAEALAVVRLDGLGVPRLGGANLLRTHRRPQSAPERRLVEVYQDLSAEGGEEGELEELEGFHPLLGGTLAAVARLRRDPGRRGAGLLGWRRGLGAWSPGAEQMMPLAELTGGGLDEALVKMSTDEEDATYPVLVLLAGLRRARNRMVAAVRARAEKESGTDPKINERQALVLAAMGTTPGYATGLAHHQAAFGVVYETARTDLEELVRMGRLGMVRRGRAFVFATSWPDEEPGEVQDGGTEVGWGAVLSEPAEPGPAAPSEMDYRDSLPVFF